MLSTLPPANAAVLRRLAEQPLAYWQQVRDPLPDLLATLYPVDDAASLLKLVSHEAAQGHVLCRQALTLGDVQPLRWHETRHLPALQAWQQVPARHAGLVRTAISHAVLPSLLAQPRWTTVLQHAGDLLADLARELTDIVLAAPLPDARQLLRLRLTLALLRQRHEDHGGDGVPLAQTDIATLLVLLQEGLPPALASLGLRLSPLARTGLQHWGAGLGQALGIDKLWLPANSDEALALAHVLLSAPDPRAARLGEDWLQQLAAADPLPAARRRTAAQIRRLVDAETARALALRGDRLDRLWQAAERGRALIAKP